MEVPMGIESSALPRENSICNWKFIRINFALTIVLYTKRPNIYNSNQQILLVSLISTICMLSILTNKWKVPREVWIVKRNYARGSSYAAHTTYNMITCILTWKYLYFYFILLIFQLNIFYFNNLCQLMLFLPWQH